MSHKCAYGKINDDCQNLASQFVWWEDRKEGWWLCDEHIKLLEQKEKELEDKEGEIIE